MLARVLGGLLVVAGCLTLAPPPALGTPPKYVLRIRPHVGDTLRMRFEQTLRATGPGTDVDRLPPRTTAMRVHSRSVVERADSAGAVILAITDSVAFDEPGADARLLAAAQAAMRGRWVRMRVLPTGAMQLLGAQTRGQAEQALSQLPGTLPDDPVATGATWTREMALPAIGGAPTQGGRLQIVFRFDSVAREVAFVSMRGALARGVVAQGGARVATTGTMTGELRVDLRRGWMVDSNAEFMIVSTMTSAASGAPATKASQLRVAITQRLHCVE